jgi:hypothetical protein
VSFASSRGGNAIVDAMGVNLVMSGFPSYRCSQQICIVAHHNPTVVRASTDASGETSRAQGRLLPEKVW